MTTSTKIIPAASGDARGSPGERMGGPKAPPEWWIERAIKMIGKGPAAAGRGLDRLARVSVLKPIMIPLSSVWTGITLLFLIGVYVGIGSGFASWRAKFEMTDLEFFDAMPMRVLIALLAINLSIVTLRRIPLTLYRVGVWTVHIGILTMLTGCVWYFSQKNEGSVRIFLNQSVGEYYDATERALYAYKLKEDGSVDGGVNRTMTPLPGLPIYFEHIAAQGNGIDRVVPVSALAGLDPAFKDATLKIVGYYPYAELGDEWGAPSDSNDSAATAAENPGVLVTMSGFSGGMWLVANSPAGRVYDIPGMPFAIEYVYHPSAEKLADVTAEIAGPVGMTVRIPKLGLTKTYTVDEKPIQVEGSPYTVTAYDEQAMPLRSKGYEDAFSNCLKVHVLRKETDGKETAFDRMIVGRYPELSPDFITLPNGQPKRIQERVDNDIQMTFHDAQHDQIWIVEQEPTFEQGGKDGDKRFEIVHRKANGGKVERIPVTVGKQVELKIGKVPLKIAAMERTDHAVRAAVVHIVPVERRQRGQTAMDAMQHSIVEVELSRPNMKAVRKFVPFVQFAKVGEPPVGLPPTVMDIPGVGKIGLQLSTTRRELPTTVKLAAFEAKKYPGATNTYEDYSSTLEITDKVSGHVESAVTHLNEPAASHGLYYFQSAWDGDDNAKPEQRFSVLGIGNRPGLWTMTVGAILMILGIGYAFYVKPILLKKKKEWLVAWNARRIAGDGNGAAEVR